MSLSPRVIEAADRLFGGDESIGAAQQLEAALLDGYAGDDRVTDLLEALALYSPGSDAPYYDVAELRHVVRATLDELDGDT